MAEIDDLLQTQVGDASAPAVAEVEYEIRNCSTVVSRFHFNPSFLFCSYMTRSPL
jgi:hypothetical protein